MIPSNVDVTISGEGSLACLIYPARGTGYPFSWSSPTTRDTHTSYRAFGSVAITTCFKLRLPRSVENGNRTLISRIRGGHSTTEPPLQYLVIVPVHTSRIVVNVAGI